SRTALRYQTVRHGCKFSTTRQVVLAREWLEQPSPASPAHGPKAYRYRTKGQWSFCSRRSRLVPSQQLETAPGQRYVIALVLRALGVLEAHDGVIKWLGQMQPHIILNVLFTKGGVTRWCLRLTVPPSWSD